MRRSARERGNLAYTSSRALAGRYAPRKILFDAAQRTMQREDVRKGMLDRGITPVWDKPGEFDAYVKIFTERGNAVLKDLGLAKN